MIAKLKALQQFWYEKLRMSGFKDVEKKQWDKRTRIYQDREQVETYYRRLQAFLVDNPDIPDLHRTTLNLYSQGTYINVIASHVRKSRWTVRRIIQKYRNQI
jgi:hypothetical protein